MSLDKRAFDHLAPTERQTARMNSLRAAAKMYAHMLDTHLPDGPDKTFTMRKLREVAMWANVALSRHPDGAPREDEPEPPRRQGEYPPDHPVEGDLGSVPT